MVLQEPVVGARERRNAAGLRAVVFVVALLVCGADAKGQQPANLFLNLENLKREPWAVRHRAIQAARPLTRHGSFAQVQKLIRQGGQQPVADDSVEMADDVKLLDGLRQRQLFDLATQYCENLLGDGELSQKRRAATTVELLKTLTATAIYSAGDRRQAFWKRIEEISKESRSTFRGTRHLLVGAQHALADVAQVRLIRQELDAKLVADDARQQALKRLRSARDLLESLIGEIERSIPDADDEETDRNLATAQLLELKTNMKFQFAVCNLERSRLYAADDLASRADALSQAEQQIEEVIRAVRPGRDLWWEATLAASRCYRLTGKPEEAKKLLDRLPRDSVPANKYAAFNVEKIRVLQATGNMDAIQLEIKTLLNSPGREAPLDLALLEASVWVSEHSPENSKLKWKTFSTSLLKTIRSSHGSYWGRRAEIVLLGAVDRGAIQRSKSAETATDADLTILIQVAENALDEKRYQAAADSFFKAVSLAKQLKDNAMAFKLTIRQSRCHEKLSQFGPAAEALLNASVDQSQTNASSAHLRGCWNLAQVLGQGGPELVKKSSNRFQQELESHLVNWPDDQTSNTARVWLAEHYRSRKQFQLAVDTLSGVRASSPKFSESIVLAADSISELLEQMKVDQRPTDVMASRLIGRFRDRLEGNPSVSAMVTMLAADIELRFRQQMPDSDSLKKISAMAWTSVPEPEKLKVVADALRSVASVSRRAEFQSQVAAINDQALLRKMDEYLEALQGRKKTQELARSNLFIAKQAKKLADGQSNTQMITFWNLRMADLHLELGENEAAVQTLNLLVKQFPRKADLRIKLAQAVTEAYGKSEPQKAINQWRRLATKLRPQSENWFLAKYNVARLLADDGQNESAEKLLKFMRATPPGWENSELKSEYDALLRRVSR